MEVSRPGAAPGLQLAGAWAEFTKALSIYPETNARVAAQRDAVVEGLEHYLRDRPAGHDVERGLSVIFDDGHVFADAEQGSEADSAAMSWLRERMAHAGLTGVEFMPGLGGEALVAFTRQLLANYLRKEVGLTFDDLWPESFDGMVLIDRRFEGSFGAELGNAPNRAPHHALYGNRSESNQFVRGLVAHPKVLRRLTRLQEQGVVPDGQGGLFHVGPDSDEETMSTGDLLKRMLDDVPAESLTSRDTLIETVCRMMDALGDAPTGATHEPAASSEFAELLRKASKSHFGRQGPGLERLHPDAEEEVEQSPGGGRKRDDDIQDDMEALVAELQKLPAEMAYDFRRGDAVSSREQLAVALHFLVHLEQPERLSGLYPLLQDLLREPGPEEIELLRAHLRHEASDPAATAARQEAIVRFLIHTEQPQLLRTCDVLTPEFVLQDPGARLSLLLVALELDDPAQLAELNGICRQLGDSLLDLSATLAPELAQLPREKAAAVLARPHPFRLPLVRVLLEAHPGRLVPEAADYLRAIDLPQEERFVLYQLRDPAYITRTYLMLLMDLHLGRVTTPIVRRAIVELLTKHIKATHDTCADHPLRLESIRSLARYPSANGWLLLRDLRKTTFGPFGAAEPPVVRKLAKETMRSMEGMESRPPEPPVQMPTYQVSQSSPAAAPEPEAALPRADEPTTTDEGDAVGQPQAA